MATIKDLKNSNKRWIGLDPEEEEILLNIAEAIKHDRRQEYHGR